MANSSANQDRWHCLEALSNSNASRTGHATHSQRNPAAVGLGAQPARPPIPPRPVNGNGNAYAGHQQQATHPGGSIANYRLLTSDVATTPPSAALSPQNIHRQPVPQSESDPAAVQLLDHSTHRPMPHHPKNHDANGYLGHEQQHRRGDETSPNSHPIRADVAPSPSRPGSSPNIPGWPTTAQEVGQTGKSTIIWRLIDIVLFLVSLLTIVMAIFAKTADRKAVDGYPEYQRLIGVTAVVSHC